MEIIIGSNVTINNHFAETTQSDQVVAKNVGKAKEPIVNHDEDVLVDSETSFFELLECLRRCPEALAAEKGEREQKEEEAREAKLRETLGEDYEIYAAQEGMNNKGAFRKADRRPGPVQLWNRYHRIAVKEIGENGRCEVYENGYGVYDNGDRRTVVWLPDCGSTTYYFAPLRESEKEYLTQQQSLDADVFGPIPWYHAVTVAGEDSIERNLVHPKSVGTTSVFDRVDKDMKPAYSWRTGGHIETPEEAYLRKEEHEEMLDILSDEQRQAFVLYYEGGYTQKEISTIVDKDRSTVKTHLSRAKDKVRKWKETK